jgi:hypothetical protein
VACRCWHWLWLLQTCASLDTDMHSVWRCFLRAWVAWIQDDVQFRARNMGVAAEHLGGQARKLNILTPKRVTVHFASISCMSARLICAELLIQHMHVIEQH